MVKHFDRLLVAEWVSKRKISSFSLWVGELVLEREHELRAVICLIPPKRDLLKNATPLLLGVRHHLKNWLEALAIQTRLHKLKGVSFF